DPDVAAESVGDFVSPYDERRKVGKPVIDREKKEVRARLPNGVVLTARHHQSQGCITLPPGRDAVFFEPTTVTPALPDAGSTPWPMGDVLPSTPLPAEIDAAKLEEAIAEAFSEPEGLTSAF